MNPLAKSESFIDITNGSSLHLIKTTLFPYIIKLIGGLCVAGKNLVLIKGYETER